MGEIPVCLDAHRMFSGKRKDDSTQQGGITGTVNLLRRRDVMGSILIHEVWGGTEILHF